MGRRTVGPILFARNVMATGREKQFIKPHGILKKLLHLNGAKLLSSLLSPCWQCLEHTRILLLRWRIFSSRVEPQSMHCLKIVESGASTVPMNTILLLGFKSE